MSARLLLIEDDDAFLRRMSANLVSAGYDVRGVSDGAAALVALQADYFDLVVTDIRLPDTDGLANATAAPKPLFSNLRRIIDLAQCILEG